MAVTKITGFRAPYTSAVFRDIVDSLEGMHGLLDLDGEITQVGPTITLPAFRVVQNGLIYEKDVATTLSAPSMVAPYYLVVTAPTVNDIDDLMFTFAKTPEDVSDNEVILAAYDGFEWREAQKITTRGILDLIAQTNIDTLRVGPFDGLRTSLNGGNYDNSPGTLVDRQGETQRFEEIASFPVVAIDPDWDRVDRVVYRRPTDYEPRIGSREFLLGGTYDTTPAALAAVESFDNTAVRQRQKVLIASDNTGLILSATGSGTVWQIDFTSIASDRLSAVVSPTTLVTGLTSQSFGAAVDGSDNIHLVYVKSGNIYYQKFDASGSSLVSETAIDTQAGACDNPRVAIDPNDTKVFVVYQALMGPSNNQIFFTSRTLAGALVTAPKNIASNAQNLITPDIFVTEDLYVYVTWENDTLGSVLFRRFDDIGDALDASATTVSTDVEQIGVGTLSGNARDPRIIVAHNRQVFVLFRQDKGGSAYGVSVYTGGSAFMQELTGPAENILSFAVSTDPIFNSLMLTLVQASSVDFVKVYGQTVSFVLNLAASGSRGVSVARDRLGSLLHAIAGEAAGTYTSYDAVTSIIAFGATSVVGSITTINVDANQFLVEASSLSQAPNADDQVAITGSGVGGNNTTKLILAVELLSLNAIDDVYRVTVLNNFTAAEDPATANGDFQAPDGNNAVYRKSVSESHDRVFSLFELDSDILLSRMVAPGTTILNWLPPGSAGSLADFLIIGGSGSIDWEKTAAGELTLTGTIKLTNIFTATEYEIAAGSYPMAEGEALYVPLDPSDLTPAPLVTPIPTLPWNDEIGVIGIIVDGRFEPSMANLRPLITGEEMVLGENLSVDIKNRLGVIDDVNYEAYTSTDHINPGDNYPEAISNLDEAVQNIFGQIQMTPEDPISTKVLVSGVDRTLLNGSIFGIKYKDRLVDFSGAVIDFATGTINEDDDVTPLGESFTPVVPAAGQWRWFAVNLLPGTVGSDNRLSVKLKVTAAASDGATKDAAPRATFTNQPDVGQVAVHSTDGVSIDDIDFADLVNLLTNFSTSEGSGSSAAQMLVSGSFSYDWEYTTAGEFTFGAGLRVQDLSIGVTWDPVAGGYAMTEGDALYIVLDTSDLTPTPQVAAITSLPVTQNILVLGAIRDGNFVAAVSTLETLEPLELRLFGESLPTPLRNRLGLDDDASFEAYTSSENINLSDNYAEAISNLDTVIAQILQQISIRPHDTTPNRVMITGAYKTLLNGSVLGMQVENLLVEFTGAEIDFDTGEIFEADGVTPLGLDFTPVIPASGLWRWFAVNLESTTPDSENKLQFRIIVTPAATDGATQDAAVRAEFDSGPKIGQVAISSADGLVVDPIDFENIVNLLTLDVGSGGGSSVLKAPAGENLSENDLVYISPGNAEGDTGRTQGSIYLVDAGNATPALAAIRSQAVGFCQAAALTGADVKVTMGGLRKNFVGLTPGIQYYADPGTPGAITTTKPSSDGQWLVPVGVPRSATQLDINPSMSSDAELIEVVASPTDFDAVQVSHGFSVGEAVYFDGTDWQLAQADSGLTMAEGIVKTVVDGDNFTVRVVGPVEGLTGLTPGAYYFVSSVTPGALTDTEPTAPAFSNPVGFALSATQLMVLPLRPTQGGALPLSYYFQALAGEDLAEGDLVYLSPGTVLGDTARTQGRLYKCDAGNADPALAEIRAKAVGICTVTALTGVLSEAQLAGSKGGFVGLFPGMVYYADPSTPGALTLTRPTTVGEWIVPVGFGTSVTQLWINPAMAGRIELVEAVVSPTPTISFTAGENISARDVVYVSPGNAAGDTGRNEGEIYKCDPGNASPALAAIRSQAIGFALDVIPSGNTGDVQPSEAVPGFSGLTAGELYYADPSMPGGITTVKPSTPDQWAVPVGISISATEILANPSASSDAELIEAPAPPVSTTDISVNQVSHGFSVGEAVYFDGTDWQLALADDPLTTSQGLVKEVDDPDNFTVRAVGPISGLTGLTPGAYYFVDETTPGALTSVEPTQVSNPVGFALSATEIMVLPLRPSAGASPDPEVPDPHKHVFTAGENLTANELVYISPGNAAGDTGRTAGQIYKCDAGNATEALAAIRSKAIGFVIATVTSGNTVEVQKSLLMSGFSSLTPGLVYYADPAVPGAITTTRPTAVDQWVVTAGLAVSSAVIEVNSGMASGAQLVREGPQVNLTVTGSSWVTDRAVGIYYRTSDGAHRLRFNIEGIVDPDTRSGYTSSISGVVFKNTAGFTQAVTGSSKSNSAEVAWCYADPGTGNIAMAHSGVFTGSYLFSGDVELESKPSWA